MILYRMELVNEEFSGDVNAGVYCGGSSTDIGSILDGTYTDENAVWNGHHPLPSGDPLLSRVTDKINWGHVFCFESEQALRLWFSKIDLTPKESLDLVQIGVYFAPDDKCFLGTFQAVAEVDYMKRVDTWRPERR